jgi:hypothetical protein
MAEWLNRLNGPLAWAPLAKWLAAPLWPQYKEGNPQGAACGLLIELEEKKKAKGYITMRFPAGPPRQY